MSVYCAVMWCVQYKYMNVKRQLCNDYKFSFDCNENLKKKHTREVHLGAVIRSVCRSFFFNIVQPVLVLHLQLVSDSKYVMLNPFALEHERK